ncbi:MAG TPA: DUF4446 family protein [Candidatus Nealsonbacteria bacterium]|uniref:DUF4446 domain-containing protein n=1 Tax=marine sediment metagenome TaxID=412755 RepID=A0A0F9UVS3_9ZZZZ|nr:DUF4446 family protein [Candidatus Nealsonbacteria bacterium]HEB46118.1 DUF4446 family protein [Candidatus Nealsonbacteria bacterium]
MEDVLIYILIVLGFLIVLVFGLTVYCFKLKKKFDLFFKKGEEDLEKLLASQLKKLEEQEKDIKKISEEISRLKGQSQKSFQKISLVRFNPFKNIGGDQSFSIALLDLGNNGFVITSIYSQEGNQVYAKSVNNGKSEYPLSEEEKEAIQKAIVA